MSYSYSNLREIITKKFMSVSVSHAPQKDPNFVEDEIVETSSGSSSRNSALTSSVSGTYGEERSSEPYDQVIKKDPLPVVENLVKPEFLKGDELTREFSFDRDIKVPHVLHLCMYKLNKVLQQPFLEFYVIKNNIEYEFPNKELSPELFEQFVEKEPEEEKIEPIVEENEQFSFTDDKRGLHQQAYHNQAKLYHQENPHLSYRDCLKVVYKKNKNIEI